jgi:hypothetical protein
MLSDAKSIGEFFRFGSGYLLTDLIAYTRLVHENVHSKIIFVGDPCQLAPVGDSSSKAFDKDYLVNKFRVSIDEAEMKEVKRQGVDSGILMAAAKIRKSISAGFFNDFNLKQNGRDIFNPTNTTFFDSWEKAASPKIIIASKNKTCLNLNQEIRKRKYGTADLPVQKGDIVIMGGNNYRKGIFNGEFAVVNEVSPTNSSTTIGLRGRDPVTLTWREIELIFPDTESNNKIVKGQVIENFLYGDNYLAPEEMQALYVDFTKRHKGLVPQSELFKQAIINDEFFNCLLIKFGYAVTCHKAQGGEWENVFTVWDQDNTKGFDCLRDPQIRPGKTNQHFYRWAYTAITRASGQLFAINPPLYSSYSSMSFIDTEVIKSLNELTGKKVESTVIELDNQMLNQLKEFGLMEQPVQMQDHFIKVRHAVRKQYIEIAGWEKKNLEIFYYFKREDKTAGLKTWVNKDTIFNEKYQKHPSTTNSDELLKAIESLIKNLPNISIRRNTAETVIDKIQFEYALEEQYPFTRNLFDDLEIVLKCTDVIIEELEHQQYRERYTFKRGLEIAMLDFEYKLNGFFGRIVPVQNKTNSQSLLKDMQQYLLTFKQEDYAS